ncbi:helix-turn-helix transcriptional regulator [Aureimonas pseudogalii]|uniref:DNA-binding protein n=1 Tax=Aureimonas pseudogalii TaxID=1744844 RepID=A0A7W6E9C3_9HYPH|nr:hypothetical protein [Aureimonas pseudogalii]MBB3997147.1 hypothetical protein [Aureimonas pseudogalii]
MSDTRPNIFSRLAKAGVPDISTLPDEALLSRRQLAGLTGYTEQALRKWTKQGRGPKTVYLEGRPRTTVKAYREWVAGAQQVSA